MADPEKPIAGPTSTTEPMVATGAALFKPVLNHSTTMGTELSELVPRPAIAPVAPIGSPESGSPGFWETAGDWAVSPVRGLYNAVQGVYSFADHIGGDWLPDMEEWKSKTMVGGFLDSAFQLMAGFGVGGLALKGVGVAGALLKLGKIGKLAGSVSEFSTLGKIGYNLAANAIGDVMVYHTDANIARMLKDNDLGTPLTNWLATDDDDPEIEKRFKGAVDGLAMGVITEPLMAAFGAYRAGVRNKRMLDAFASGDPVKIEANTKALNKHLEEVAEKLMPKSPLARKPEDALVDSTFSHVNMFGRSMRMFIQDGIKDVQPNRPIWNTISSDGTPFDRMVRVLRAGSQKVLDVRSGPTAAATYRAYESVARYAAELTIKSGKKLDTEVIGRAWDNLTDWLQLSEGAKHTMTARWLAQTPKGVDGTVELAARVLSAEALMQHVAGDLKKTFKTLGTQELLLNPIGLAEMIQKVEKSGAFVREFMGITPHASRNLSDIPEETTGVLMGGKRRFVKLEDSPIEAIKDPKFHPDRMSQAEAIKYINERGGQKTVLGVLQAHKDNLLKNEMGALINTAVHHEARRWDVISEWWINGILSHGQTSVINLISNIATSWYRPLETIIGGTIHTLGGAAVAPFAGKATMTEGFQAVKNGFRTLTKMNMAFLDTFGLFGGKHGGAATRYAVGEAWKTGDSVLLKPGVDQGKIEIGPAITSANLGAAVEGIPIIGPIAHKALGIADRSFFHGFGADAVDRIGKTIRIPQRVLAATDQLFKQINFRAKAYALILDEAESAGIPHAAKAAHIKSRLDNIIKEGQALTNERLASDAINSVSQRNPTWALGQDAKTRSNILSNEISSLEAANPGNFDLSQKALAYAKEVTFTDDAGKLTQFLKGAISHAPMLRLVMPFISTPINLLKFAYHRSVDPLLGAPLAVIETLSHQVKTLAKDVTLMAGQHGQKSWFKFSKDFFSADPLARSDALGRWAFATGFFATAVTLANNSMNPDATIMIHGRGPHDPNEARTWKDSGRLPYSIQFGKSGDPNTKSYQFNRLDPFGMVFGTIADLWTYSHFATPTEQTALGGSVGVVLSSIGNNLVNKTYLQGLSDFIEILQGDDPNKTAQIIRNFGASMMIPNAANSPAFGGDEENTMREVHSFLDAKLNRSPWGADKLTPQRNPLGEPVKRIPQWGEDAAGRWAAFWSPIKMTRDKGDPLLSEMARLAHPFKATEDNVSYGGIDVDLTQFRNAKGQTAADRYAELVGSDGQLRKSLTKLINSDAYKKLPEFPGDESLPNPKVDQIGKYFAAYRGNARAKLWQEFPDVQKFVKLKAAERSAGYSGAK